MYEYINTSKLTLNNGGSSNQSSMMEVESALGSSKNVLEEYVKELKTNLENNLKSEMTSFCTEKFNEL